MKTYEVWMRSSSRECAEWILAADPFKAAETFASVYDSKNEDEILIESPVVVLVVELGEDDTQEIKISAEECAVIYTATAIDPEGDSSDE